MAGLIAAALGADAAQAATVEGLSWATTPFQLWAGNEIYKRTRRGENPVLSTPFRQRRGNMRGSSGIVPNTPDRSAMIPTGGNRKRHRIGHAGSRKKHARSGYGGPYKPVHRIYKQPSYKYPGASYAKSMNMGCEVVALHDLKTFDLDLTEDTFFCLQPADVLTAPAYARYTRLYDRMRFIKLKVEFYATDYTILAVSCTSQSFKTQMTDKDVIMRQPSCRFHNLKGNDGNNAGRTFEIANIAGLGDHVSTSTASNGLSVTNTGTFDAGIHFCILHSDVNANLAAPAAIGRTGGVTQKLHAKFTFVMEFMSQTQKMEAAPAESGP